MAVFWPRLSRLHLSFAVWLVNEQFYAIDFVGMLLILLAVLLISLKDILVAQKSIG